MGKVILLISIMLFGLSACTQSRVVTSDPTELKKNDSRFAITEKCENAKYQLDKSVEEGHLSDLKELKQNIELYCIWRRN